MIAADEDFSPLVVDGVNLDDATGITASQGSGTKLLLHNQVVQGSSVYVGLACNGGTAVPAGNPTAVDIASSSAASTRSPRRWRT